MFILCCCVWTNVGAQAELKEIDYLIFMSDIDIYIKLATLSDDMKKEVDEYVDFLKSKTVTRKKATGPRKAGLAKGLIRMKEGFDDPLDDFKEYMG